MDTGNANFVESGRNPDATLHPPFEHSTFYRIGIHHPAAQKAEIAVFEALAGGVGLALPVVELEFHRHIVIEDNCSLGSRSDAVELLEEMAVCEAHSLDLQGLRVFVKVARGDNPWR